MIRCAHCIVPGRHATVAKVQECAIEAWGNEEEARQEVWAEGAWLRAAEAGSPDIWAEQDRDRLVEAWCYGPA